MAIIGIPALFLIYRLAIGVYYSPENSYARNKSKIETARKTAATQVNDNLDKINTALLKIAPTIPADELVRASGVTYRASPNGGLVKVEQPLQIPEKQEALKGDLIPVNGAAKQDGCYHVVEYGGSKFNRYPVGEHASCIYGTKRAYTWSGSEEKLKQLVEAVKQDTGLPINNASTYQSTTQSSRNSLSYTIAWLGSTYPTTSELSRLDLFAGSDWEKIFLEEKLATIERKSSTPSSSPTAGSISPSANTRSSSSSRQYILLIQGSDEYVKLFDRTL